MTEKKPSPWDLRQTAMDHPSEAHRKRLLNEAQDADRKAWAAHHEMRNELLFEKKK